MQLNFKDFQIDTNNASIFKNGERIALETKVFNLIAYFALHQNQLISRQEIMEAIWGDRIASEASLSNLIKSARQALGDDGVKQEIIKTIHGRGYQFLPEVTQISMTEDKSTSKTPLFSLTNSHYIFAFFFITLIGLIGWQFQLSVSTKPVIKIAVLPLNNVKPDPKTDYVGFAVADQLIGKLSYLHNVSVIPSSSIRKYISQSTEAIDIGKQLDVDFVLTGNFLKEQSNIRLNTELIDVKKGQLKWRSKQLDINFNNTFELQDIVTRTVIDGLKIELSSSEINLIKSDMSNNPLAYEYYLKALAYPLTSEGHLLAIKLLQASIGLDADFAPAYVQLGNRLRRLDQFGLPPSLQSKRSYEFYQKALQLNPNSLDAMAYLSMFYTESNQIDKAYQLALKMYKIKPNSANSHFTLGYIYRYAGLLKESLFEMEAAISIEPHNPQFRSIIGTYSSTKQYNKALLLLQNYPPSPFTLGWKGIINRLMGKNELAIKYFSQVIDMDNSGLWRQVSLVFRSYLLDDKDTGLAAIKVLEQTKIADGETIYYISEYYCLLGEYSDCISTLDKAVDAGYFNYPRFVSNDYFQPIQNNAEFIKVLNKAKARHLQFKSRFFN